MQKRWNHAKRHVSINNFDSWNISDTFSIGDRIILSVQMKTDNILRFISMIFSAYSFIATILITYIVLKRGDTLSPLELSALLSAGIAAFIGIVADLVSIIRED